jgi:hypothetical protein
MDSNNHVQEIPEIVLEELKRKAKEMSDLIQPYSIALTPHERHDLPKMGEKTVSFVEKAHELAKDNPDLCPNYFDLADFTVDIKDAIGLMSVKVGVVQVAEVIDDIELLAGSEAYQSALTFYNYIKMLADRDVPKAKAIYEELKKRFPNKGRRKPSEE